MHLPALTEHVSQHQLDDGRVRRTHGDAIKGLSAVYVGSTPKPAPRRTNRSARTLWRSLSQTTTRRASGAMIGSLAPVVMLRGCGPLRKGGLEPRLPRRTRIKQNVAAYRAVRREDVRRRRVGLQSATGARHIRHGSKLRPAGTPLKAGAGSRDNAARSWPRGRCMLDGMASRLRSRTPIGRSVHPIEARSRAGEAVLVERSAENRPILFAYVTGAVPLLAVVDTLGRRSRQSAGRV